MKNFMEADKIISGVQSVDYWEENEVDEVRTLIQKFSESDWKALESGISSKSDQWKARCAQALSVDLSERSFKMLLSLLNSRDYWTVIRAIVSLEDFNNKFDVNEYAGQDVLAMATTSIRNSTFSENFKNTFISKLNSLFGN